MHAHDYTFFFSERGSARVPQKSQFDGFLFESVPGIDLAPIIIIIMIKKENRLASRINAHGGKLNFTLPFTGKQTVL